MVIKIEQAIAEFKKGQMVIMVDDEHRENEGDFVLPAALATPEAINFMIKKGGGLICVATTEERLRELGLEPMVRYNTSHFGTNFWVTVDARNNLGTGTSAYDRAETIKVFTNPEARPADLIRPGHIYTLGARDGGVLQRAGHTEGAVDLTRLSGLFPAAVICEILKEDGSMARLPDLMELAKQHRLGIITVKDLIAYRMRKEQLVKRIAETQLPNKYGTWNLILYESINNELHLALTMGKITEKDNVLVRVHSQCFTGDTLGSLRCDCGAQLHQAMELIAQAGCGVLLYMHQEGRGIGLKNKIIAYHFQDQGKDTVEANEALGFKADLREYGIGAQILVDLGLKKIRIMTNNPRKIVGLEGFGLEVVERVPLIAGKNKCNIGYLKAKSEKMGHLIDL